MLGEGLGVYSRDKLVYGGEDMSFNQAMCALSYARARRAVKKKRDKERRVRQDEKMNQVELNFDEYGVSPDLPGQPTNLWPPVSLRAWETYSHSSYESYDPYAYAGWSHTDFYIADLKREIARLREELRSERENTRVDIEVIARVYCEAYREGSPLRQLPEDVMLEIVHFLHV